MRHHGSPALLLAALFGARLAAAQPDDRAERADALFREALTLLEAGRHAEACPKLEESQKLDPAVGTEFNLADCYERTARPVAARKHFAHVAQLARATGKTEREQAARERLAALDARLAHLSLQTSKLHGLSGVRIQIGEREIPANERDQRIVLEPGTHAITVTADRHVRWRTSVALTAGTQRELAVPKLAPLPVERARPAPKEKESGGLGVQRIVALTGGALGIAGLGVGTAFGILSLQKHNDAEEVCPEPNPCGDQEAADTWTEATTFGNVSTIAFVAGGVLTAGAVVLWFTAPSSGPAVRAGVYGPGAYVGGDF